MKSFFCGVLLILIVGIGGIIYRNAAEHPTQTIVCPIGALLCPDGTSVARTGSSCTFPVCPPPNVALSNVGISFALPAGFSASEFIDAASVAAYDTHEASSTNVSSIIIRRYMIAASSTPLATMQKTAISGASGAPMSTTSFTSTEIGNHRFTVVNLERYEGTIDTAYYLARSTDVLRFDAVDMSTDWTNPNLDTSTLPAHGALAKLLDTLGGQ